MKRRQRAAMRQGIHDAVIAFVAMAVLLVLLHVADQHSDSQVDPMYRPHPTVSTSTTYPGAVRCGDAVVDLATAFKIGCKP